MSDETNSAADIAEWFSEPQPAADEQSFTESVMAQTRRMRRRRIAQRVMIGLLLAAVSIPAQDLGLAIAELAMVQLVEVDNQLAAGVLAPINTVGGVLSVVLLFLRTVYRRMLRG